MELDVPKLRSEIKNINYGTHCISPLYKSPLLAINGTLNVCSKCLSFHPTSRSLENHMAMCTIPFIPIYEEEDFKISKVTPLNKKQNLCLVSQMFLKSKTLYYEVDDYDFFVVYQDEVFGYFSRQRSGDNSLNCFMVFPCFQKQGWGTVLVSYSQIKEYAGAEASGISNKIKGAGKPYSKKAIFCFRKYWKYKVIGGTTVREISLKQNIPIDDAIVGLELQGFNFEKWEQKGEIDTKKPRMLAHRVYKKNRAKTEE